MKTQLIKIGIFTIIVFGLLSCKTYYIPIDSFKEQFKDIDSTKLKIVNTRSPIGTIIQYPANQIEYIKCVDKKNNTIELKNSPSIEIKFTLKNNKKITYYFDRIYLQDSLIIGSMSRIIKIKKSIPLNEVKKIEIQDGHKNFKYVD